MSRPSELASSKFMGTPTPYPCSSKVWADWGTNQVYPCPELFTAMSSTQKFVIVDDWNRLWDSGRGISLENPVLASLVTEAMMNDPTEATLTQLAELYQLSAGSSFQDLFDLMRATI